jgi:hypothetical protein
MTNRYQSNNQSETILIQSDEFAQQQTHRGQSNFVKGNSTGDNWAKLRMFFCYNPSPVIVFNPQGRVIGLNSLAQGLLNRLHVASTTLLPENHTQIVLECYKSADPGREGTTHRYEVTVADAVFGLVYHALPAFNLVYAYVVEITQLKQTEENILRILNSVLAFKACAKEALVQLQELRQTFPHLATLATQFPEFDQVVAEPADLDPWVASSGRVSSLID